MKTILWTQNENTSIKDSFVIDEQLCTPERQGDQDQAFSTLTKASSRLTLSPEERSAFAERFGFAEQTNYCEGQDFVYIQGCYEEKDERGRHMPYMFFTSECNKLEEAFKFLENYSSIVNKTCKKRDLEILRSYKNSKAKKKSIRQLFH